MEEFAKSVNEFLAFRRYDILPDNNKGKIFKKQARKKAEVEYIEFNKTQRIESDFDKAVEQIQQKHDQLSGNLEKFKMRTTWNE